MFQPSDWERLITSLISKTIAGKVDWSDTKEPSRGHMRISSMHRAILDLQGPGELVATVGSNTFRLGSADADGREPYFLEVSRDGGGAATVDESIRSDFSRHDPESYRLGGLIASLHESAKSYVFSKGRVVEDIIADIENA